MAICNGAQNIEQGDVHLSPAQRALFSAHRKAIAEITSRGGGPKGKGNIMQSQKCCFPFIPILIGTAQR